MKFVLPIILLSPLILFPIPLSVKGMILTIFILFTGTLGSSVKLSRLRESGMLQKLAVLPLTSSSFMSNYVLANTFFNLFQLLIPTTLIILFSLSNYYALFWISISYISVILAANSIGVLVALISGSSGEVHLYSTLTVLVVAAVSIPFTSTASNLLATVGNLLPFRPFYDSLLYGWGIYSFKLLYIAPISAAVLFAIVLLMSPRLFNFD